MKAPVGLLSDRTVLRSKMEGPCPDKFTLTQLDLCGNLSQQFNITYLFRVPARLPKEPEQVFDFLIATQRTRTKAIPEGVVRFRLLCGDFLLPNPAPHLENRKTVCMGYPAMTPKWESRKTPLEGGRKSMQGERRTQYQLVKMAS